MKSDKDKLQDVTTTLEKRIVSCETDVGFKHVYDWALKLSLINLVLISILRTYI